MKSIYFTLVIHILTSSRCNEETKTISNLLNSALLFSRSESSSKAKILAVKNVLTLRGGVQMQRIWRTSKGAEIPDDPTILRDTGLI